MSDEKKPFAEVVASEIEGWQQVRIGGEEVELTDMANREEAFRIAAAINAAVEEREGALRYVLAATADAVERALSLHEFADDERTEVAAMARFARQLLEGGGPDYVPAAELKALKDSLAVYQPMIDQLLEAGGQATEVGYRLARALGLLDVRDDLAQIAAKMLTDDELRAECTRRDLLKYNAPGGRVPIPPRPFVQRGIALFNVGVGRAVRQGDAVTIGGEDGTVYPALPSSPIVGHALYDSEPALNADGTPMVDHAGRPFHRVRVVM